MREQQIEHYFVEQVKKNGGVALKFVSPGNTGVPDRIVIFPGIIHFVELKSTVGVLSPTQKVQHKRLAGLGFDVTTISTKEAAKTWAELNGSIAARMAMHGCEEVVH
jgi:hypothetical protein